MRKAAGLISEDLNGYRDALSVDGVGVRSQWRRGQCCC